MSELRQRWNVKPAGDMAGGLSHACIHLQRQQQQQPGEGRRPRLPVEYLLELESFGTPRRALADVEHGGVFETVILCYTNMNMCMYITNFILTM